MPRTGLSLRSFVVVAEIKQAHFCSSASTNWYDQLDCKILAQMATLWPLSGVKISYWWAGRDLVTFRDLESQSHVHSPCVTFPCDEPLARLTHTRYFSPHFGDMSEAMSSISMLLVPRTGLEPVRPGGHKILSLACLPIPPPRHEKDAESERSELSTNSTTSPSL